MILHGGLRFKKVLTGSWRFLLLVASWELLVVYLDEIRGFEFIGLPIPLVTTVGIAVSLYLGFKNTSCFARWWQARTIWGQIVNSSRDWGNAVANLMPSDSMTVDPDIKTRLIERHIAWVNALAFQLRVQNPRHARQQKWMFGLRRLENRKDLHQTPESYRTHLSDADAALLDTKTNAASYLLFRQGQELQSLADQGKIDAYRHVAMMDRLARFYDAQGSCERIKNAPFPRQVADIGKLFTWIFIFMLPLAFVNLYTIPVDLEGWERWAFAGYTLSMIPFCLLICWVFYLTEQVSASLEDPFNGDATDVPISTISRMIEIDLRQTMEMDNVPDPLPPVEDVAY
ncbi:bestrophin family protein [Sedimentitalea todarodis]|uniref:Bestrophin family ion channel n=1 Tax=Sedimentitalea todarodis TaxID=1631240 RepID=A0ABU3VGJ6_9RHOB|nr:bestrophin family ion channel [Sedimentitalea todarodis]MDU9005304.1 bestrophin family ion channel [Sedimentitalea todarodis]